MKTKQITLRVNKLGVTPYDGKQGQLLKFCPTFSIIGPKASVEVIVSDIPGDACSVWVFPKGPLADTDNKGTIVSWNIIANMWSNCFIN